jgi:hypothetical protein
MMNVVLDILDCLIEHKEVDREKLMKLLSHWRSNIIDKYIPELRRRGYISVKHVDGREIICKGVKLA